MQLRGGSDPFLLKEHCFAASRGRDHNVVHDVSIYLADDWRCFAPSTSVGQLPGQNGAWADGCMDY